MATKKQKKSGSGPIIGLFLIGLAGLAGLAMYVKTSGASQVPAEMRRVPALVQPSGHPNSSGQTHVKLVSPSREGTSLKLDEKTGTVPNGEDPRLFAVNHFLQQSNIAPNDAKAIGIQVKDKVAYIDVTKSFEQSYGSLDEEAMLKGLCASLAQFPEVDKVQFLVEGKAVQSLGNVDLSEPIPVRERDPAPSQQ
jgi:hypothetical protein